MKIEMDYGTERFLGYALVVTVILAAMVLIGYCVYGYRHERLFALEHGYSPNTTISQPTLMNEYERPLTPPPFKGWDSLTR